MRTSQIMRWITVWVLAFCFAWHAKACQLFNQCNGHGRCASNGTTCICDDGWGSLSDITLYRAPDCSARTCPSGKAWADYPTGPTNAHALAECSNSGLCNRDTGVCECFPGFTGSACQRTKCPNNCSGHGKCKNMNRLARDSTFPIVGPNVDYGYWPSDASWDSHVIFGCVCDSSWPVGYDSGQYPVSEWFGPDCSMKHCPSGWDRAFQTVNSTDCFNVTIAGSYNNTVGMPGSLCFQECSGQGSCNYTTGTCNCFPSRWGVDCGFYVGYVPPVQNITVDLYLDDTVEYYANLARSLREVERESEL